MFVIRPENTTRAALWFQSLFLPGSTEACENMGGVGDQKVFVIIFLLGSV